MFWLRWLYDFSLPVEMTYSMIICMVLLEHGIGLFPQNLIWGNWQIADPFSASLINSIGYCCGSRWYRDFPGTFGIFAWAIDDG